MEQENGWACGKSQSRASAVRSGFTDWLQLSFVAVTFQLLRKASHKLHAERNPAFTVQRKCIARARVARKRGTCSSANSKCCPAPQLRCGGKPRPRRRCGPFGKKRSGGAGRSARETRTSTLGG